MIVIYILLTIALSLNCFGLHCLRKVKDVGGHQRILLLNITCASITWVLYTFLLPYVELVLVKQSSIINIIIKHVGLATPCLYLMCVILISLDRLFFILLWLKYKQYITTARIKKMIIIIWMSSICMSFGHAYGHYILKVLGFGFLVITTTTYAIIGCAIRKRHDNVSVNVKNVKRRTFRKHYLIPFLIIITFVVFYGVPFAIDYFTKPSLLILSIRMVIICIGFSTDPIIYLYLNRFLRKTAVGILRCGTCRRKRNEQLHIPNKETHELRYLELEIAKSSSNNSLVGTDKNTTMPYMVNSPKCSPKVSPLTAQPNSSK